MGTSDQHNTTSRVIDFGAHLLPTERQEDPTYWDIEVANDRFTSGGVDGAVLSWSRYIGHDDVDAVQRANDTLLEVLSELENYFGLAALPSGAGGDDAAREFERCLDEGWNGGAIQTTANGINSTDEEMAPVYEVADRAGAPLLIHPKINDSLGPDALDDRLLLNSVFGREIALCETICRMIHGGLLDRYREFTPVIHHTGGNIAAMLGRLQIKLPADPPDHLKPTEEFIAQLRDRIYIDTSGYGGNELALGAAREVFSTSNMLFGSDYPYETRTGEGFRNIISGIKSVATDDEIDDVLGKNALNILVNTG